MKTFKELQEIDTTVGQLYEADPTLKDSKFGYAFNRFYKLNMEPSFKEFEEKLADARVDHALEDEKTKELLRDDKGNLKYSREGQKALMQAQRKLTKELQEKQIEITPFFSSFVPPLTDEQYDVLKDCLVAPKKK